ncbi:hypothetical protein BDN70DRAFT_875033 [Pholiota conissans]|uniref:Uncharacterized protein n=1 Tax=Pholiota conissans TaxID=109636 RepID=A0A9P5Z7L8_9AGAR|nr:hypothetical protein BDN70DRAFT_875033 [Pholiota conissans]
MPPAFNFLKNLANHQVKAPSPNQQTESTFSNHDHGDSSPNKLRRKSKKSTKGHIPPVTTSSRQMDAFGGILGHEVDDIGPSRYPAHPFQSIPGSVGNHYLNPNEVRSPDKFSQGLPRSDNSWSRTKEHPPVMQSHSLYDTMPHHNHDFHTSTPHPPELGQRRHEANTANSFVTPDETPIVSQYTANGVQHGQTPSEVSQPSRSWSPIPSVHRASVDDDEPYSENHEHDVPREAGNQSWITDGNLGNRFSADITDPRISTMADLGQPDSMSIHTIHYVEYPQERSPQAAIPRSMPERWVCCL